MTTDKLIAALRNHVNDRGGPARDTEGAIVNPNGAWVLMLKAAERLEELNKCQIQVAPLKDWGSWVK
jgi:hypothetical protein